MLRPRSSNARSWPHGVLILMRLPGLSLLSRNASTIPDRGVTNSFTLLLLSVSASSIACRITFSQFITGV